MNTRTLRVIYHITRADFLERIRRYGTLVTVGLAVLFTVLMLPEQTANYLSFNIGHVRGVYNSAWVGAVMTIFGVIILSGVALHLARGGIERDETTGVGQIIATTPLSKRQYTLGKFLSNFVYLAALSGVVFLVGVGGQLLRGEELRIDLWAYLGPYLWIVLPVMAAVSALAVLGDSLVWLRHGRGSQAVILAWVACVTMGGSALAQDMSYVYEGSLPPAEAPVDVNGVFLIFHSMYTEARQEVEDLRGGLVIATLPGGMDLNIARRAEDRPQDRDAPQDFRLRTFEWSGIQWTGRALLWPLLWFGGSIAIATLAGRFFDRFDPSTENRSRRESRSSSIATAPEPIEPPAAATPTRLTPLPIDRSTSGISVFARTIAAELRLMFKGLRPGWYVVAAALIAAGLLVPVDASRQLVLPVTWVWPLLIWSPIGNRETRHNTQGMVFATAFPLRQHLWAGWAAGFIVALITGSGVALSLILAAEWSALIAWGVAALFIPTLALALGVLTDSSKTFEGVYLILLYLGPWNKIVYLDFMGTTEAAIEMGVPIYFLMITVVLLAAALVGRRRQIQA